MDWQIRVDCRDGAGRPACVTVGARGDELVLIAPPGEAAVFAGEHLAEAAELAEALAWGLETLKAARS